VRHVKQDSLLPRNSNLAFWAILTLHFCCLLAYGNESDYQKSYKQHLWNKLSNPYCGIHCLYTTMRLAGKKIDIRQLIKPEYVGSRQGSSFAELKKAAEDYEMHAVTVMNLTSTSLRQSPYPVILHVKSDPASTVCDHYELFLGTKENKAQIFDPPNPSRLIPFYELAPRWDGTGLIVSNEPISLTPIFSPDREQFIIYAAIAVVIILAAHWLKWRWLGMLNKLDRHKLFGLSIVQGVAFITLALFWGTIYHFANDEGFLAHANATATIQQAQFSSFIPKINMKKTKLLLSSGAIIIDARHKEDFDRGHLKGAINIPVDSIESERRKKMEAIDKSAIIVVYCQSDGCKYADKIAVKLLSDGFTDISIYRGGWNEWTTKKDN
jgi:rhodanese-related sulfurtransferase